jgi:hypothetical protein
MVGQPPVADPHLLHAINDLVTAINGFAKLVGAQQPSTSLLTPWSLLTATAGLVAFHIGLFTLVGRERKSPYVINWIFPIFLLCLLSAVFSLCSSLVGAAWHEYLLVLSAVVLVFAFLISFACVYKIRVRFVYFVDGVHPQHFPGIRQLRRAWGVTLPRSYEHSPTAISAKARSEISTVLASVPNSDGNREEVLSVAVRVATFGDQAELLADLALKFLGNNYSVQYLTASRHPIEFVQVLKARAEVLGQGPWEELAKRVVAIDGYSPHFAFLDSIYQRKDRALVEFGINCITSKMTFAGLHTASSSAFKKIRTQMGKDYREPTLVIYEGCYALADLESPEQYRVFVRHVIPSERMWGGMFTVFVEAAIPDQDWNLLKAYANMKADLTVTSAERSTKQPRA